MMNEPQIDLTGKLIIKVQLGDDIRRILITNEDITYDELMLMMQRVYRGKLSSTDDIVIKYKDEDNDLITIFDSSDLTFATQCSRILKITLFVNGKPEPLQSSEVKHIKKQLQNIRDQCNSLLDRLDDRVTDPLNAAADSTGSAKVTSMVTDSPTRPAPAPRMAPPPVIMAANSSKEFDPLSTQRSVDDSQQNKVMSSFGIANDTSSHERPGTPDSVTSVGSSSSHTRQATPQDPQKQAPGPAPGPSPTQQPFAQPTPSQQPAAPGVYGGPSLTPGQKIPPWQQQQSPSHPSANQAQPSQTSQYPTTQPGYSGGTQSQFGSQPGQPQTSQPGFGQPSSQYGYSSTQGGAAAANTPGTGQGYGQAQPGYAGQPQQSGQQQPQTQYAGFGQQQPPQQPGIPPSQAQPGQGGPQPGQGGPQSGPSGPAASSNPYARPSQGPGYPSGYPRPAGNYQGYQ